MAQKKAILEEMQALDSLKNLAESYEELAAAEIQKIRGSVLATRDFLSELSDVFVDLKSSYPKEVKDFLERRKKGDKTIAPFLQKNGKLLMVYLSSNGRLYGPVTKKTFDLFINDIKEKNKDKVDVLIIGNAGKEMFENSSHKRPFEYVDVPDENITIDHLRKLMKIYLKYEGVNIYYGKFGNVVRQNAISTSITGDDIFETEVPSTVLREDRFIFEPIFEKVFNFFETQIMSNLFKQTYHENQLARQASRVNAMEEALIHIEEETKKLVKQKIRIKHILQNKKQLEMISGFVLWEIT
jgi:F0F1-type ATP synthase gamma subunit